ncbi:MFS transporter [Larsenimonas rhizosphaerae]|uniref:MFS transporter n=1 Tax=Larsenimonas rhizosphaerae TaxID=2944682 RepID=A0AA41ZMU3_9GAMM|nr:MFS transporter [Larsenimonas rhizosphaerae]MCX2524773.1 MFS transporter [Larsenimonas rhizosphaerae]
MTVAPRRVLQVVLLGTGTVSLGNSMLNPALPSFMQAFSVSAGHAAWVVSGFMVSMVLAMPLTSYLGQRYGRRRLYLVGMSLYTLGAVMGGVAFSFPQVLMARAVQGAASGLVIPLALPLLFKVFPAAERGRVTGVWASVVMLVPAVGPLVGALMVENGGWRGLFIMQVPLAVLAGAGACRCLPGRDGPSEAPVRFDGIGYGLIVTALLLVMGGGYWMSRGGGLNALAGIVAGLMVGAVLVRHERHHPAPLLALSIFGRRDFCHGMVVAVLHSVSMFSSLVLIPLWVQVVMGRSALWTGTALLCTAVFASGFGRLGGRWLDLHGPRWLIGSGLVVTAAATVALGRLPAEASIVSLCVLMALRGAGIGLSYMPSTTVALHTLPEALTTQGAAISNIARRVTASLAVVAVSVAIDLLPARGVALPDILHLLFTLSGLLLLLAVPSALRLTPTPIARQTGAESR